MALHIIYPVVSTPLVWWWQSQRLPPRCCRLMPLQRRPGRHDGMTGVSWIVAARDPEAAISTFGRPFAVSAERRALLLCHPVTAESGGTVTMTCGGRSMPSRRDLPRGGSTRRQGPHQTLMSSPKSNAPSRLHSAGRRTTRQDDLNGCV
jgi:hypothetical protein